MKISIYALICPIDKEIKYIGKTKNGVQERYFGHTRKDNSEKSKWIQKLKSKKLKPLLSILQIVVKEKAITRERYWIKKLKKQGYILFNKNMPDTKAEKIHKKNNTIPVKYNISMQAQERIEMIQAIQRTKGKKMTKEEVVDYLILNSLLK